MRIGYRGLHRLVWALTIAFLSLGFFAEGGRAEEVVTPGRPEYVEKITEEQLKVALAEGSAERARLCIGFARERLRELETLRKGNQHGFTVSLVKAWRVLMFDGAVEATRKGSRLRFDMRSTFEGLASAQEEFSGTLNRLAGMGGSAEAIRALEEAAEEARQGAQEMRGELKRERVRVARHDKMLKEAGKSIRTAMIEGGLSASKAESISSQILQHCRTHSRVRVRLILDVLESAGMKTQDPYLSAVQANRIADTGAEEVRVRALVQVFSRKKVTHREMKHIAREIERISVDSKGAATATGAVNALILMLDKGMVPETARSVLSQCRRLTKEGIPSGTVFGFLEERVRAMKEISAESLEETVNNSLRAVEAIREELRLKLREHRDQERASKDRASKKGSGSGKGAGGG